MFQSDIFPFQTKTTKTTKGKQRVKKMQSLLLRFYLRPNVQTEYTEHNTESKRNMRYETRNTLYGEKKRKLLICTSELKLKTVQIERKKPIV